MLPKPAHYSHRGNILSPPEKEKLRLRSRPLSRMERRERLRAPRHPVSSIPAFVAAAASRSWCCLFPRDSLVIHPLPLRPLAAPPRVGLPLALPSPVATAALALAGFSPSTLAGKTWQGCGEGGV